MRKIMLAAMMLLAATLAYAADVAPVPVKAPVTPHVVPRAACPLGTGFYAGLNTYGQVANGSVAGTSVIADGQAIGFTLGHAWGDCTGHWYGIEGLFNYQNLGGAQNPALVGVATSLSSHWEMTQRFKFGANLQDVMAFLPNFGTLFPGMPTAAPGTSNPKVYIAAIVREADVSAQFLLPSGHAWSIEPGIGTGIQTSTANGSVIDVFTDYTFKGAGFTAGLPPATSANLGGVWRAGVQILY